MHQIFEISFLNELQDDELDIKADFSNSSDSEMDAQDCCSNGDNELNIHHQTEVENFTSIAPISQQDKSSELLAFRKLPMRSYNRFFNAYETFNKWKESKDINSFDESVLLAYFHELATKCDPLSVWQTYTMLKTTISSYHNINVSQYHKLIAFLREFRFKKRNTFTTEDVNKFMAEAPDDEYLAIKSLLVFLIFGVSKPDTLINVKADYVKDNGKEIIVRIPDQKTNIVATLAKLYVIDGQFAEIVQKYMRLRQATVTTERFFVHYRNGKCVNQAIGSKHITKIPKEIAKFLKLPEWEAYSFRGTSFHRTSTIPADTVVEIENQQELLGGERIIAQEMNSRSTSNVIIESQENVSKRIATDPVTDTESTTFVHEISDESTVYIPEDNPLSEKEGGPQGFLGDNRIIWTAPTEESTSNFITASHENASQTITTFTITSSESSESFEQDETVAAINVSKNNPLSQNEERRDFNDDTGGLNRHHRTKAPKRKRKKRPKRKKKINWYQEECLAQVKLMTDMFKRFSNMREDDKMKMLSEFSIHRVELFKKYFAEMNAVAISPINTPTTSKNTAALNGDVTIEID